MELLRIFSMFLILLLHSNYNIFGIPKDYDAITCFRRALHTIALTGVNVFVLITGYYGASFKLNKIINLVYQCFFACIPVSLLLLLLGLLKYSSPHELIQTFYFWRQYWFIIAYIGLLILTPGLNYYIEKLSTRQLTILSISLYILFGLGDFILGMPGIGTNGGFTVIWFVVLYFIGRLINRNLRIFSSISKCLVIFFISYLCELLLQFKTSHNLYTSPFLVLESVSILALFSHFRFHSKIVNTIAASTTMVYLVHTRQAIMDFSKYFLLNQSITKPLLLFMIIWVFYMISEYTICILYDQIRIKTWNWLLKSIPFLNNEQRI